MNKIALLALADTLKALRPDYRAEAAPGKYVVDETLTVRIRAKVSVGEDHESTLAQKANPWGIVAVLLQQLEEARLAAHGEGVDLEALIAASLSVSPEIEEKAQERANEIVAALKGGTKKMVAGVVRLSMNVVDFEEVKK